MNLLEAGCKISVKEIRADNHYEHTTPVLPRRQAVSAGVRQRLTDLGRCRK